jgi:hypothetical protein
MDVFDMPDWPLNPFTGALPVPDLRRAIHRLQLWVSTASTEPEPSEVPDLQQMKDEHLEELADWNTVGHDPADDAAKQLEVLRDLLSHTETLSFIDSRLTRKSTDTTEVSYKIYVHF